MHLQTAWRWVHPGRALAWVHTEVFSLGQEPFLFPFLLTSPLPTIFYFISNKATVICFISLEKSVMKNQIWFLRRKRWPQLKWKGKREGGVYCPVLALSQSSLTEAWWGGSHRCPTELDLLIWPWEQLLPLPSGPKTEVMRAAITVVKMWMNGMHKDWIGVSYRQLLTGSNTSTRKENI
jgi:hypothetical protein